MPDVFDRLKEALADRYTIERVSVRERRPHGQTCSREKSGPGGYLASDG
jgi:hypothetical protein